MNRSIHLALCSALMLTGGSLNALANDLESHFIQHTHDRYFPMHMNVRSMGMGGTFVGIRGDSASILGNPAGLGGLEKAFVSGAFQFEQLSGEEISTLAAIDEDIYGGMALGAYPITPELTAGIGFVPRFSDADHSNDLEADHFYVPVNIAYALTPEFSLGYGIGYVNDDVSTVNHDAQMDDGLLHRFGLMYQLSEQLDLGLMGSFGHGDAESNTVGGADFDGDREAWSVRGGAAWQTTETLLLALDLAYEELESDGTIDNTLIPTFVPLAFEESLDVMSVNLGAEYAFNECTFLRLGTGYTDYDYSTNDTTTASLIGSLDGAHLSGGFGYDWTESITTDVGSMIRFYDEIDFMVGGQLTIAF